MKVTKWKQRISMLLTAVMLISLLEWVSAPVAEATAPSTINGFSNSCKYNPTVDGPIPSHIAPCNIKGYKFNSDFYYRDLWVIARDPITNALTKSRGQRFLIVYGSPDSLPIDLRDFKPGWQDENAVIQPSNEGHFVDYSTGTARRGEYRFIGFDSTGSLYPNDYYIRDSDTGRSPQMKNWIIEPWKDLPNWYTYKPLGAGPVYSIDDFPTDTKFDPILANIQRSMGFLRITTGIRYADRYRVLPQTDANIDFRNYMNIPQDATTREPGIGMMYHYNQTEHSLWYQSFPLLILKPGPDEKTSPPAVCAASAAFDGPLPSGKERFVDVDVIVTGALQDEEYYNDVQNERLYYTRKDIASWDIKLLDREKDPGVWMERSSTVKSDGVVMQGNEANAKFKLKIDTHKIVEDAEGNWTYSTNASVTVYYANHSILYPSEESANCMLKLEVETGDTMKSDFGVTPSIQFKNRSEFERKMIGYQDFSYGKDADYYTFEITNEDDGTAITRTFDPAIPEVKAPAPGYLDQQAVNSWLYDFIRSKFASETSTTKVVRTFHIKQIIVDRDVDSNSTSTAIKTVVVVQQPTTMTCEMMPSPPKYITPQADWPLDWFDIVPFPVTDAPPDYIPSKDCETSAKYSDFSKRVYIDGIEIDAERFFNGQFMFGEERIGLRQVKTTFTAPDGTESFKIQHVVIHESKPYVSMRLEGLYKQNRTMRVYDQSAQYNDQWVEQNAPLEITSFSYVNADDPNLKCRVGYCESNLAEKMYMYKEPGRYKMSLAAKRVIHHAGKTYTRYSDPYEVDYEIMPDHTPAVIAHAYANQISRLDNLQFFYEAVSTDGDYIAEQELRVYYDSDNDGSFDTLVFETDEIISELPVFDQLGQYKIEAYAKDSTNEDRLMEFITAADDKEKTMESFFFIDNFAPASDLYMDVPVDKQDMDIYIMLDSNLKQASTDYVKGNRVTITNAFTQAAMLANVDIWDMKTYTYSQSASTSIHSGRSSPPSSTYYSSNGYSGTLSLSSVSNPKERVNEGKFQSVTDSKTATGTCSSTAINHYDSNGNFSHGENWNNCGSTMSYSDGRYTGTLTRNGETANGSPCGSTGPPNGSCSRSWTANYAGTVYWTRDVFIDNWVYYDDYTGFYSGTIYRSVRQPYSTSFMREVPNKYVIYISDNRASQLVDLQNVMNKHSAKLILVGHDDFQTQIDHEKFIRNDKPIDQVIGDVIEYIAENNPEIARRLILVGEEIETRTATFDWEEDPIRSDLLQIIQDAYYYDNSMGFDSFNGQALISVKSESNWQPYQSAITFIKPGKYTFFRKVKDHPTDDPNFADYAYYSNESAIEVLVHRKPIPDVILDFDYMASENRYRTTWIDTSYDLDHNITRAATDRGIQARSLKLTNQGTGEVYTRIPATVQPGTYVLDYIVQDIEGAWSEPLRRTYVLPSTVPVQIKSNLRTEYSGFSLSSVPASEKLVAYELWTRYPYAINLQLAMGSYINRTVPHYTGTKSGNDIAWSDETLTIPNTTPDGTYTFTIRGNGSVAGSTASHSYTVRVVTPINLSGRIDATASSATNVSSLVVGDSYTLRASTTKYPDAAVNNNATTVVAFKGTSFQRTITLSSTTISSTGYGQKNWSGTAAFQVPNMPDGNYTFEWISRTPNGNIERIERIVEVVNNRPPTADFTWSPQPVYEGDTVAFSSLIDDEDRDPLTVHYILVSPSGEQTNYNYEFRYPYPATAPTVRMLELGNWRMRLTVSDGRAAPVIVERVIAVLPLHAAGEVHHTAQWNKHRQDYNRQQSGDSDSPRGYDVFWAGEKFVLAAFTTDTGTGTTADRVEVALGTRRTTLSAADSAKSIWQGELWDEAMERELVDGPIRFLFTAYYNNGVVKTAEVVVEIRGTVSQIVGVHRVK